MREVLDRSLVLQALTVCRRRRHDFSAFAARERERDLNGLYRSHFTCFRRLSTNKVSYHCIHAYPTLIFESTLCPGLFVETVFYHMLYVVSPHSCSSFRTMMVPSDTSLVLFTYTIVSFGKALFQQLILLVCLFRIEAIFRHY